MTFHPTSTPRPEGRRWDNLPVHAQAYIRAVERALELANDRVDTLEAEKSLDLDFARVRQQSPDASTEFALPDRSVYFCLGDSPADRSPRVECRIDRDKRGLYLQVMTFDGLAQITPNASNVLHVRVAPR